MAVWQLDARPLPIRQRLELIQACIRKNSTQARELLPTDKEKVDIAEETGLAPLHVACMVGDRELVNELLSTGVSANEPDIDLMTPLHFASHYGYREIARALIRKHAKLNIADCNGRTPVWCAANERQAKCFSYLVRKGADCSKFNGKGETLLTAMAKKGHDDIIEILLNTDGGLVDVHGSHALHIAAFWGNLSTVEIFLQSGINPNTADNCGFTAIYYVAQNGYTRILETLLSANADPHVKTSDGEQPLHAASLEGHQRVCEMLLAKAVDVNAIDKDVCTPLHCACITDRPIVARLLIKHGADKDAKDIQGRTPMWYACRYGSLACVEMLIECKADMRTFCMAGYQALHQAAQKGHTRVVQLLLSKGVECERSVNEALTPVQLAEKGGHKETTAILMRHEKIIVDDGGLMYPGLNFRASMVIDPWQEIPVNERSVVDKYLEQRGYQRIRVAPLDIPLIDALNESARFAPCLSDRYCPRAIMSNDGKPKQILHPIVVAENGMPSHWTEYERGLTDAVGYLLRAEIYITVQRGNEEPFTLRVFVENRYPEFNLHITYVNDRYDAVVPIIAVGQSGPIKEVEGISTDEKAVALPESPTDRKPVLKKQSSIMELSKLVMRGISEPDPFPDNSPATKQEERIFDQPHQKHLLSVKREFIRTLLPWEPAYFLFKKHIITDRERHIIFANRERGKQNLAFFNIMLDKSYSAYENLISILEQNGQTNASDLLLMFDSEMMSSNIKRGRQSRLQQRDKIKVKTQKSRLSTISEDRYRHSVRSKKMRIGENASIIAQQMNFTEVVNTLYSAKLINSSTKDDLSRISGDMHRNKELLLLIEGLPLNKFQEVIEKLRRKRQDHLVDLLQSPITLTLPKRFSVLQSVHDILMRDLEVEPVVEKMYAKHAISSMEHQSITELHIRSDKIEKFIRILRSKDENTFELFKRLLSETNQDHITQALINPRLSSGSRASNFSTDSHVSQF